MQQATFGQWSSNSLGDMTGVTIRYVTGSAISTQYQYSYPYTAPATFSYTVQPGVSTGWYNSLLGSMFYQTGASLIYGSMISNISQPPETAEEKAARQKRAEEREAKRKAASLRAEHLLFTILTPSQVRQYTDDDYFDVVIDSRTYRIKKGYSRNVELIEAGKPKALYCAHPADASIAPVPDAMLAQLLMLKTNEQEFLRLANRTIL